MNTLLWDKSYELGIAEIDAQHKEFVSALNDLITNITDNSADREAMKKIFQKIENYTVFHFTTEERYFDLFQYEGALEHKKAHKDFIEQFKQIQMQYETQTVDATFHLADFLEDWLINHLMTLDTKYVACFHEHGL